MPQQITLLKLFVSCSEELAAERKIIDAVVSELNPKLRDSYKIELRVVSWATHVVPGAGDDPQAVINSQLGDDYDIYLGMLGARFGTPTPRAGSGTEEEFLRAHSRYKAQQEALRIFFYFKNSSDTPLQTLNLEELAKVQAFRNRISGEGILYSDFKTADEFLEQTRNHLWNLIAHQWQNGKWKSQNIAVVSVTQPQSIQDAISPVGHLDAAEDQESTHISDDSADEKGGILDAMVEVEESIQAGMSALERLTEMGQRYNTGMILHASTISRFSSEGASPKILREAVDAGADVMDQYARSLRGEIPVFVAAYTSAFDALEEIVVEWRDKSDPQQSESLLAFKERLTKTVISIKASKEPVTSFRGVVVSTRGVTRRIKRAIRSVRTQLDELIAGITVISDRATKVLDLVETAIKKS